MTYISKNLYDYDDINDIFKDHWKEDQYRFCIDIIKLVNETIANKIVNITYDNYQQEKYDDELDFEYDDPYAYYYVYTCEIETSESLSKSELYTLNKIKNEIMHIIITDFDETCN